MKRTNVLTVIIATLVVALAMPMGTYAGGLFGDKDKGQTVEDTNTPYEVPQKQLVLKEEKIISPAFQTAVGRVIVPEGWDVAVLDLALPELSMSWPNAVIVTVTSPDRSTGLIYVSNREFMQKHDSPFGNDMWTEDNYYDSLAATHYLNYRMADACCEFMLQNMFPDETFWFVKEYDFTEEEKKAIHKSMDEYGRDVEEMFQTAAYSGIYMGEFQWSESSVTKRQFRSDSKEYMILATSCGFMSRAEFLGSIMDRYLWDMPGVYILRADSVAEYEELFDVFCAVTSVSQEYKELCQKDGVRLTEEYYRVLNSGGSFTTNDRNSYDDIEENTIDSGDTYSAVDAWDDYIRGDTDYTTGSGDHVKVSNQFDHVFELNDEVILATNSLETTGGGIELDPTPIG